MSAPSSSCPVDSRKNVTAVIPITPNVIRIPATMAGSLWKCIHDTLHVMKSQLIARVFRVSVPKFWCFDPILSHPCLEGQWQNKTESIQSQTEPILSLAFASIASFEVVMPTYINFKTYRHLNSYLYSHSNTLHCSLARTATILRIRLLWQPNMRVFLI